MAKTSIVSDRVEVPFSQEKVFHFVSNMNNLEHLMPVDKISDWKSDEQKCEFKVQGGIVISLELLKTEPTEKVFIKSGIRSPFPFTLDIEINSVQEKSEGVILFEGEINTFVKMMVEKPLTSLFNHMAYRLSSMEL